MNLVKGIDVSYYDDILNWSLYDNDFAFIKISEGTVIDKVFKEQWRAAKGRTIRGAYHFFRPFVDPKLAAQKVAEYLGGDLGELPLALDLETTDSRPDTIARALVFIEEYRKQTFTKPIIYTAPGFLSSVQAHNYPVLADYKLWLATYPYDKIYSDWTEEKRKKRLADIWENRFMLSFPVPPRPFKRVSFWQFTGKGDPNLINGYASNKLAVDMNFYNSTLGDIEDMYKEFNIQYVPEEGEEMIIYGRITALTNIRSSMPGGAYQDIGDLPAGSLIEADIKQKAPDGTYWYHLTKATNPNGGPILTTFGKVVSETSCWCFGNNVTEYTPTDEPPATTRKVESIEISNPESVTIHYDDGTSITHP
jgi:GH25 family lysozyme M1 (1,4-beta-N-acetylmuramidase)